MTITEWVTIVVAVLGAATTILKTLQAKGHAASAAASASAAKLAANSSYGKQDQPPVKAD